MPNEYINPGDLVWIQSSYERSDYPLPPRHMRTTGLVLECLPAPKKYWYKVMMTYAGVSKISRFPLEMLIKIED